MRDPLRPLTSAEIRGMTQDEITAFWIARQQALKAQGREHYTTLRDAGTWEVIATVPA
jgi:hypothetical protein